MFLRKRAKDAVTSIPCLAVREVFARQQRILCASAPTTGGSFVILNPGFSTSGRNEALSHYLQEYPS